MGAIRKLSPELVSQIAAGEVIDRPASVVKELIENSIDAGARRIEIQFEDGGRRLIRVVDDGSGIAPEDLPLAVASHATSKVRSVDDLFHVTTLGFRGEALASVGSVAYLRLASRQAGAEGAEIVVRGGKAGEVKPAGIAPGTIVEVRDLFFNVPARRKFLRDGSSEARLALEAATRIALGAPSVAFRVASQGRLSLEAPAASSLLERIADLFGAELASELVPVSGTRGRARLAGYVALPHRTRGDQSQLHVTLNGRPIRDKLIGGAVKDAYHGFLMVRRFPIAFLALEVEPEAVDVNVHPAKLEVRFREPRDVFGLVASAIRAALDHARSAAPLAPARALANVAAPTGPPGFESSGSRPIAREASEASCCGYRSGGPGLAAPPARVAEPRARYDGAGSVSDPVTVGGAENPRPIEFVQLASGYLVVPSSDGGLEVIDPHALHERLLFEELRARVFAGALELQQMLIPLIVELAPAEEARLAEAADSLAALGFVVEPFGPGAAAIRAVPALLEAVPGRAHRPDYGSLLHDLLGELEERPFLGREHLAERLLATAACKGAVKLGEPLAAESVAALLDGRLRADRSHLCPHGRPTVLRFGPAELERQFKR